MAPIVAPDKVYERAVDIYAPCSARRNPEYRNIGRLKCAVVAGAANNQLADENEHGRMLLEKGILYAPPFLINAGD